MENRVNVMAEAIGAILFVVLGFGLFAMFMMLAGG